MYIFYNFDVFSIEKVNKLSNFSSHECSQNLHVFTSLQSHISHTLESHMPIYSREYHTKTITYILIHVLFTCEYVNFT